MFKTSIDNIRSLQLRFTVYAGILGKNDIIALTCGTDYIGLLIIFLWFCPLVKYYSNKCNLFRILTIYSAHHIVKSKGTWYFLEPISSHAVAEKTSKPYIFAVLLHFLACQIYHSMFHHRWHGLPYLSTSVSFRIGFLTTKFNLLADCQNFWQ